LGERDREFRRDAGGWREVMVTAQDGRLAFALGPPAPLAALDHRLEDTAPGEVVEVCPALPAQVRALSARIARQGGLALIVDYGGWRSRGDTLQAVAAHARAEPLAEPGAADLTAHVDFEAVAAAARAAGAEAWGPEPQGDWLMRLGLGQRAEALARGLDGEALKSHRVAVRRLTDAGGMGTVFKAMALTHADGPPPPGFAAPAPAAFAAAASRRQTRTHAGCDAPDPPR